MDRGNKQLFSCVALNHVLKMYIYIYTHTYISLTSNSLMQSNADITDDIFRHYCLLDKAIMTSYGPHWQT
jgi:hypothetical protein